MKAAEIRKALAAEIDGVPVFEAVICVLDAQKRNWQTESYGPSNSDERARYDGAQEGLDELRTRLYEERLKGRADVE